MAPVEAPAPRAATTASDTRFHPLQPGSIVADETSWRALPAPSGSASLPAVTTTRWRAPIERPQEYCAETANDRHVLKIVLRNMNIRLSIARRTVQDGIVTPGMFHLTEPGVPVTCLFRGPYDVLHLHIPNGLIAECARDTPGNRVTRLYSETAPSRDAIVERLGRALLDAEHAGGSLGQIYADCIGAAIVARLLCTSSRDARLSGSKVTELPRWRLKRAIDYVEAHLAEPISLADVASATGLTRMHFAAQFRAATGLRPHEYLLRRRIERAQELLADTSTPVVEVALSVGFQTQSHFTSVFNKFVGLPPRAWRLSQGGAQARRSRTDVTAITRSNRDSQYTSVSA